MLVLGAANTGKSTLIRNIRMNHDHDFNEEETKMITQSIRLMTLSALSTLASNIIDKASKDLRHDIFSLTSRISAESCYCADPQLLSRGLRISRDPLIQDLMASKSCKMTFYEYRSLLSNVEAILSQDYVPSNDDILASRIPTTGITETVIEAEAITISLIGT